MNSLSADIQFGLEREDVILQSVKKYFDTKKMIKSLNKYCVYDAEDTSTHTRYEIKARRNKYNAYPTTIIPYHKRNGAKNTKRLIFVFGFTDGLYYIEYNEDLFNQFETKDVTYYRKGIQPKPLKHYCIPIELLTLIHL